MAKVAEGLITKLDARFLEQGVMDVMKIVYPLYWIQANVDVTFPRHLEVIRNFYSSRIHVDNPRMANLPLWSLPFSQVGIWMLNKACLS